LDIPRIGVRSTDMVDLAFQRDIRNCHSVEEPEPDLRDRMAVELEEWISGRHRRMRVVVAVAGIEGDGEIQSPRLGVRPLRSHERGDLLEQGKGKQAGLLPPLAAKRLTGELPTHLVWFDVVEPAEGDSRIDSVPTNVLTAFALHGFHLAGLGGSAYLRFPEWVAGHRQPGAPVPMPDWAYRQHPLGEEGLGEIDLTVSALRERHSIAAPRDARDLALHRFSLGCSRTERVDALLDHVIALEALLLPYDPETRRGDLAYRFRMHGAYWMGSAASRASTFRDLRDLYDMRSRLVHGGKYPSKKEIAASADVAQQLAAVGLRRALHEQFPSAKLFNEMLLGQ
jgi:hypothetical protein